MADVNFEVIGNDLCVVADDGTVTKFCDAVYVERVITDFFSGDKKDVICVYNPITGLSKEVLPRDSINSSIVKVLRRKGVTCPEDADTGVALSEYLLESDVKVEQCIVHNRLGFHSLDTDEQNTDKQVFLAHRPIGDIDVLKRSSRYVLPDVTRPQGSMRGWRRCVRACMLGRPNLELSLAFIALAPVSHILREAGVVKDVPIVSIIGQSSTGKTGVLRTIASAYGRPEIGKGVIMNLHATQNAFFARLSGVYGWPILVDESTVAYDWDFSKQIYTLPNGKDKDRCSADGKLKESATFSGAMFLSGEKSLVEQTIGLDGIKARILEVTLPWTTGVLNAECLEQGLSKNYGHAVYPLIGWLMGHTEWLSIKYNEEYNRLKKDCDALTGVECRVLKLHTQIVVSAEVVKRALQLPIDIDGIRKILKNEYDLKFKKQADTVDIYDALKTFVVENMKHFPRGIEPAFISSNAWGYIDVHDNRNAVYIMKSVFEKRISALGINVKDAKLKLYKSKLLYRDTGRHYYFNEQIGATEVPCCILYLSDNVKPIYVKTGKTVSTYIRRETPGKSISITSQANYPLLA